MRTVFDGPASLVKAFSATRVHNLAVDVQKLQFGERKPPRIMAESGNVCRFSGALGCGGKVVEAGGVVLL